MAITSLDGILAGLQPRRFYGKTNTVTLQAGRWASSWSQVGVPGPGAYDTTLNGVTLSSTSAMVNGQIPHVDPVSGNAYLLNFSALGSQAGTYLVCDRLWHNGGMSATSTSPQSITSPTWPSRCADGTANGLGVFIALEISATMGTGTPTVTVTYTNSGGTGSRTGTNTWATISNAGPPLMFPISMQGADTGVRSVESLQLSATWSAGTMNLVAYRILAVFEQGALTGAGGHDFLSLGMPRLYNGVVPYLMVSVPGTAATYFTGSYQEVHG